MSDVNFYDLAEPVAAQPASESIFARIMREKREKMSPQERQEYDRAIAAREALEASNRPIQSTWEWREFVAPGSRNLETKVTRTETKAIQFRVEPPSAVRNEPVVQFLGGPTGHEAYLLNQDFVDMLSQARAEKPPVMSICAGTPGRYPGCTVRADDLLAGIAMALKANPSLSKDIVLPGLGAAPSRFMATPIAGSKADADRMRDTLRLAEVWARTTAPRPGRTDMILTATWGVAHDQVIASAASAMRASEDARQAHKASHRRGPHLGISFDVDASSRLAKELIAPMKALAEQTGRTVTVLLGDKPSAKLPAITIEKDGSMRIKSAMIADPAYRGRANEDVVPAYPQVTLAKISEVLSGGTRSEQMDVVAMTAGKTPAYDAASYAALPADHADKKIPGDAAMIADGATAPSTAVNVLRLDRNSIFNTPNVVSGIMVQSADGRTERQAPTAIDQAAVLRSHIRNEFMANPDYAVALASTPTDVVVAPTRAEAYVMAAAVDTVAQRRNEVLLASTPAETRDVAINLVSSFETKMAELSKTMALPAINDLHEADQRRQDNAPAWTYAMAKPSERDTAPMARFNSTDLVIMASDQAHPDQKVVFQRAGLTIEAHLDGAQSTTKADKVSGAFSVEGNVNGFTNGVTAEQVTGTSFLRRGEGYTWTASVTDVLRIAETSPGKVIINFDENPANWGVNAKDRVKAPRAGDSR